MTDPNTPPRAAIGQSVAASSAPGSVDSVAAEDLDCLRSALADWERERAELIARSHALEIDAHGKVRDADLRLHEATSQLEASKRAAQAVRVRLEADLQKAHARAQHAQETLAAGLEASEQLRVTNAELSTAIDAAQWRLNELDAENAALRAELAVREHAHAAHTAELQNERGALRLRVDELTALVGELERECDRLRRDRGSAEDLRRLKADSARLEAKIVELDRQRSDAVQRHSAAVAGYMMELNQRSEALHAREAELQKLTEELARVRHSCDEAVGELTAQRLQQQALERELADLRAASPRSAGSTSTDPSRAAPPPRPSTPPVAQRVLSAATSPRRPSPSDTISGPVTVIHLEETPPLCEVVREAVARLPGSQYVNVLDTPTAEAPGSRLLLVNLLNRTHDPIAVVTSFIAADTYQGNVLAYCAEGDNGFSFGTADFFSQPFDPDACLARLLESRGAIQRVLVVTDNFGVIGAMRDVLSRMRASVSAALDLRQVFDLLPLVDPDVALIDLSLPRGEGLRVVSRLRSDPKTQRLPLGILLASPGNATEFRQHALRAARDLPMTAAHLLEVLNQRLEAPPGASTSIPPLPGASATA